MSCMECFQFSFQRLRHVIVHCYVMLMRAEGYWRKSMSEIKLIMQICSVQTLKTGLGTKIVKGEGQGVI